MGISVQLSSIVVPATPTGPADQAPLQPPQPGTGNLKTPTHVNLLWMSWPTNYNGS